MTRTIEVELEERTIRAEKSTLHAVYGGLASAVAHSGGILSGFSMKLNPDDVLMVLRAVFPGGAMIAFVGSETMDGALRKAVREGNADRLTWRPDKWAK